MWLIPYGITKGKPPVRGALFGAAEIFSISRPLVYDYLVFVRHAVAAVTKSAAL
jgi:hypothetical protein